MLIRKNRLLILYSGLGKQDLPIGGCYSDTEKPKTDKK